MRSVRLPALTAATLLAGALALTGCGSSESGSDDDSAGAGAGLSVGSAYMPQPVSDSMAAGFLVITNKGATGDVLTRVTSDVAGDVTVHKTVGQTMEEAERLAIPAHGELALRSGGDHLMFEQLKRKPREGEKVAVQLHFAKTSPITVEMPVKSATYNPKTGH
ncbi:copper chaperone PCu(A)C [Streptomyces sp. WI04-05B]|uniref:copper chaperone PCu(A)C n=1 Tax=Streptomyces TaxID=1883 RepID=UPI0029A2569D|nr:MULTISPECIES: copper chaperone PCu(A)C [unclassified Streptomyces]MDX2542886.1 copper chaperone PCu(A)C [Streptomyces sp. WI04-05B]MDX2588430.1 copper chaperone PCu(A)C [Streptomyces sp. WI04-05A]